MSVRINIQTIRALSNDLAGFLRTLPDDVWRDAEMFASACDRWNMADVVAHLIDVSNLKAMSIQRALKGETGPPLGYRRRSREEWVQSTITLREAFDEDLFPEFNASCLRINRLLVDLDPDQYDLPAWHPMAVMDVATLIELRLMELAVHGWDIRYGVDRAATINPVAHEFLKGWVHRWLRAGFRAPEDLASAVTLRFALTDTEDEAYDLRVSAEAFSLRPVNVADEPEAVLSLDTSSYILFLMGRLPLRRSVRRGRIALEGDSALAEQFPIWFRGI